MELFYSDNISGSLVTLDREESMHCVRVLRHREGDRINVIDGKGTLLACRITDASPKAAQAVVDKLRGAEHCDVVICLSHLGLLGVDSEVPGDEVLLSATRGIDLLLGGHTHTFLEQPAWLPNADGKQVPVMHTGKNGACVGQLTMTLEKE